MIGQTNSQVGGGIKGEKVNISLLTNQPEHSALMGAIVTVKYGKSETQYVWEGFGITVTIPPYLDYEVSVSGVEGYKTPEKFTATAQADNARSLNFEYKTERVKVTLSAVGGASVEGATVNIYGQEYTFNGTPIEVLVPFDEVYSVQGNAFGGLIAPSAQSFTASTSLREINLEYRSCVLVVNMLSNQPNDATINALKASVAYGESTIEVANGVMVDIPSGTDITITFQEVENYNSPSPITFTSVEGVNEKSATYTTELVTVNASANDGASVDGVTASVVRRKVTTLNPANGVYIQDVDGFLYTEAEWDGSKTPNGVAVVTDECKFVVALDYVSNSLYWSDSPIVVDGVLSTTSSSEAQKDYLGESNTNRIINTIGENKAPAAQAARDYIFPNGQNGYLGAAGEWSVLSANKTLVDSALTKCSGTVLLNNNHWTSTQVDNDEAWAIYMQYGTLSKGSITYGTNVRSFAQLNAVSIQPTDPEEKTITNGKAQFKVVHGLEYDVVMSDKQGYKTPDMQSFVADSISRYVDMEYQKIVFTDLSKRDVHGNKIAQTTANCYVVSKAGQYKFPLVFGNAIVDGEINAEAYTKNSGSYSHDFVDYNGTVISSPYIETVSGDAASVQLSIADTDGVFTDLSIVDGSDCRYVQFTVASVPKTGANGVISIKNASGTIMWNWHVWVWEDDLTPVEITNSTNVKYNILPVNLASKWDEDAKTHIKNWFYQFGRPTPLLCPSAYNSTTDHASYGVLSYSNTSKASNIQKGIQNPTTFYYNSSTPYNWFGTESYYNLWDAACTATGNSDNDVKKTVYDPSPVGFKMPNGNTFTYFSEDNVVGSFTNGWKFKRYSGDTVGVFFPASGYRNSANGSLSSVGSGGYVWLSSALSQSNAYYLFFSSGNVTPQDGNRRAYGFSVRPVQE